MKDQKLKHYFQTNQTLWDAKTKVHVESDFYDMEAFLKGKSSLNKIELEFLKDIKGKSLLHLQCHFGQDTLSLARMGAKVTGVDLSTNSIETARKLNDQLGLDAQFINCNIYDLPQHLDQTFDLVFLSYGAICWLPDLEPWANMIYSYLKPGGQLIMAELHPFFFVFDHEKKEISYDYFRKAPYEEVMEGTYANTEASIALKEYFWVHSLSSTFSALMKAGMKIQSFKEYDYCPYDYFPNLEKRAEREYVFPLNGQSFPHVYSLVCQK